MNDAEFGFKEGDLQEIINIISRFSVIQKAVIFGSRAKGNYKSGSDVDIAIWLENEDITPKINGVLNDETCLPYMFDVLNYQTINNPDLKEHIDRVGINFYKRL